MKKVIRLTESELVNLVKNVIKEQLVQPAGSNQTFGVPSWTPEMKKADLSCVDAKLFTQKSGDGKTYYAYDLPSAVSGGVAERVVLYSDGTGNIIARGAHNKGKWKCGTNGVEFISDADPKAIRYLGKVQAPAAAAPAVNTTNCAASLGDIKEGGIKVLKFGCSTEAVKELQKLLGMETKHQTGYFGNITKNKVIEFQRGNKDDKGQQLKDDGVVGDKTYNALVKVKTPTSNNIEITSREREVGGKSEVGRDGVEFPNTTTYKRF
jgi:peptidoglycan hydrolase-like protein with peptidoglycan-binding domain